MSHQPAAYADPKDTPIPPSLLSQQNYKSRIVVVEDFYHERTHGQPVHLRPGFRRFLKTNDQAYGPRELTATPTWQRIDCGWIQQAGMILIVNGTSSQRLTYEETESSTLELLRSISTPDNDDTNNQGISSNPLIWLLPPEESLRGSPTDLRTLWVRSRHSEIPYTITVIPE